MVTSDGWCFNESVLTELFGDTPFPKDSADIRRLLRDCDIRDFGLPTITDKLDKESAVLHGPVVLQITRYRNVSYPRISESSHANDGIVRLYLTDGHGALSALILDNIQGIGPDTPPGTKLLLVGTISYENGFAVLNQKNTQVLGGRVERLIEKWNIEKNALFNDDRGTKAKSNAPKWVSFGKRAAPPTSGCNKVFRANEVIQSATKKGDGEENASAAFEQQRKEQIDAVKRDAVKGKTFAAPQISAPPKPIVSAEEQERMAKEKMRERAMKEDRGHDRRRKGGKRNGSDDDEPVPIEFQRPSAPSTLFDFMAQASTVPDALLSTPEPPPHPRPRNGREDGPRQPKQREHVQQARGVGDSKTRDGREQREKRGPGGRGPGPQRRGDGSRNFSSNEQLRSVPGTSETFGHGARNTFHGDANIRGGEKDRRSDRSAAQRSTAKTRYDGGDHRNRNAPVPLHLTKQNLQNNKKQERPVMSRSSPAPISDQRRDGRGEPRRQRGDVGASDLINKMSNLSVVAPPPPPTQSRRPGIGMWKIGDQCLAPWEDGQLYVATVVYIGPGTMCVVRYDEYGNTSTLPQGVLIKP